MATVRLQSMPLNTTIQGMRKLESVGTVRRSVDLRRKHRRLAKALAVQVCPPVNTESDSSAPQFASSIGSPSTSFRFPQRNLTHRHFALLYVAACVTSVSATWLFCSAIPAILAMKRAAESMEKLLDVTRQELPDTMAAIRLSGMEISDLTMELSDFGQTITKGVRNSTQAVRVAEEGLRGLINMTSTVPMQVVVANPRVKQTEPVLASTARRVKEGIIKSRATMHMFFGFVRLSKMVGNYLARRAKQNSPLKM